MCLTTKHRYESCTNKKKCNVDGCEENHNSLLHKTKNVQPPTEAESKTDKHEVGLLSASTSEHTINTTYYRTLPVILTNPNNGKSIQTWAFLDEGSAPTMILDDVADQLELQGEREEFCTTWTDESVRTDYDSRRVKLQISGCDQMKVFNLKTNGHYHLHHLLKLPNMSISVTSRYLMFLYLGQQS